MVAIEAPTLGRAWLAVTRRILEDGAVAAYDGAVTRELAHVSVSVAEPDPGDALIDSLGDPEWSAWMRENFTADVLVPELGGARSYGARLRDHEGSGRDQVRWVIERLRADPETRSAAITTFEPATDSSYIPCISLLDFWLRGPGVELVVYAHSLDFGKKAYGNLVELARLQREVADGIGARAGRLLVHAKSAHVYEPEWALMEQLASAAPT
jgi:thymidylate synthase